MTKKEDCEVGIIVAYMKYIVGNWKSNKKLEDAKVWLEKVAEDAGLLTASDDKVAIVCPPYTLLYEMKQLIADNGLALALGAQNCSPFEMGAYTGEITASEVRELGDYVILGHSERREHFHETKEMLETKVGLAKAAGLKVIFCVQGADTPVPQGVDIVAYEPIFAIGSGTPDTPENAEAVCKTIKDNGASIVLYGGSVKPENIATFTAQPSIDGALIGGASLEADSFLELMKNA